MFHSELTALRAVGVHPHVLRLLESYQNVGDEDVLVLEYCDGGDLYELYARNNGVCMLEGFVIQLIRQLLSALQHLAARGVEHRDVKPENLLLYGVGAGLQTVPQLKLADFGWGLVAPPGTSRPPVPPDGVGSLWYAPPELNPPVPGVAVLTADSSPLGSADLWSVGVITYLLLIGHSPFNTALRISDPAAREAEVIRMAALGQVNQEARSWPRLSPSAQHFVMALVQPDASRRMSAGQALQHPWIRQDGFVDSMGRPGVGEPSVAYQEARRSRWCSLDGFQRLSWLAVARAVAEPELVEVLPLQGFVRHYGDGAGPSPSYLEQLAEELAIAATPAWFSPQASWCDVFGLAFQYLDMDRDGSLSTRDLMHHLTGSDAATAAEAWVVAWKREATSLYGSKKLGFAEFCVALASPGSLDDSKSLSTPATSAASRQSGRRDGSADKRINAIEVCNRFFDDEFVGL